MLDTLLKVIPFSLAGAINPLGILIIITFLAKKDRPIKRAWVFLAASILVLIALIFFTQYLLKHTLGVHDKSTTSAIIDIAIGAILMIWILFHKNKKKPERKETNKFWEIFLAGIIFMALLDVETIIVYIASMKIIFDAYLAYLDKLIIYIINIAVVMSTMALPVILVSILPQKSDNILNAIHNFFTKYGTLIAKIVMFAIALYLIYIGIKVFY